MSACEASVASMNVWDSAKPAWNYTQGTVYSGIVSGNALPEGFVKSTLQGSEWLTGGAFGVEASGGDIVGPCILEAPFTTIVVPEGVRGTRRPSGSVVLEDLAA